jgi:uncharacterized membrane protein
LIASRAKSIRARVFTFADMPPSGSPQLTAAESSLLLKWLDAGTPEFANQSPSGVSTGTGTGTGTGTDPLPVGPKFSEIKDKIFAAHDCLDCHGPQQTRRKQIHTVAKLLESGYIVVGEPQNSPLYTALIRDESDSKFMPRGGDRLPESEIKLIEQWIKDGAPDDTVSPGP